MTTIIGNKLETGLIFLQRVLTRVSTNLCFMPKQLLLWVINAILLILCIVMAFQGWRAWQHATILVEWTTASELNTVGYRIYRSTNPDERGKQINQELIPSSIDPLTGGSYQFEDQDVQPGVKYYYSLEEVENNGATNQAGTIEVAAKQNGWWEIGLAALLLAGVIVGVISLLDSYREPAQ